MWGVYWRVCRGGVGVCRVGCGGVWVCMCEFVFEFEILGYYDYPDCFVGKQKIKRAATMLTIS